MSTANPPMIRWAVWPILLALLLTGCDQPLGEWEGAQAAAGQASALEHVTKHLDPAYLCPLHPNLVQSDPGSCRICGMGLMRCTFETGSNCGNPIAPGPAVVQTMGVRTTTVKRGTLWKYISAQGRVTYDEDRILQVRPRTSGWIETLYVRTAGERVDRGDDLAEYLSPSILRAQADYISALEDYELVSFGSAQGKGADHGTRVMTSRDMLRQLKVPERYIKAVEAAQAPRPLVPIKAPQGGFVIAHQVREGMYVQPGDSLFTIADLSEVWVMVDIAERQIGWVRPGLAAKITTPAYPGRSWQGTLEFVYPEVHANARTLRARLELSNPYDRLLPNMFVEVVVYGGPKRDVLIVPREAVVPSGERELVVKVLADGRFQPVEVETGIWRGDRVEVTFGLSEGDEIVLSAQFLIDSESSLQASLLRMSGAP